MDLPSSSWGTWGATACYIIPCRCVCRNGGDNCNPHMSETPCKADVWHDQIDSKLHSVVTSIAPQGNKHAHIGLDPDKEHFLSACEVLDSASRRCLVSLVCCANTTSANVNRSAISLGPGFMMHRCHLLLNAKLTFLLAARCLLKILLNNLPALQFWIPAIACAIVGPTSGFLEVRNQTLLLCSGQNWQSGGRSSVQAAEGTDRNSRAALHASLEMFRVSQSHGKVSFCMSVPYLFSKWFRPWKLCDHWVAASIDFRARLTPPSKACA